MTKPNLTSVSDFFEWRADRNPPSVENFYSEYTTKLGWKKTDVLYSFLGVYVLGLIAFYPDQFRITDYYIKPKGSKNSAYSERFLSSHYSEYLELNNCPALIEFLGKYFEIGNVNPIWPGGNTDKGFSKCFDIPDVYFKSNTEWYNALKTIYPTAFMDDIIGSPYNDTPSLLNRLYANKVEYSTFLKHICNVISSRTEQLSNQ